MKQKVRMLFNHPLISGSSVVLVGSFVANVFNYIFSYSMGRWFLSSSDFGLITTLSSIYALFALFPSSLNSIFAKFSAQYYARDDKKSLNSLILNGFKLTFLFGLIILAFLILLIPFSSSFLHIRDIRLTFLIFLSIFIAILSSLPLGILQGRMRFYLLSILNGIGPFLKIIFGVYLFVLGLKVFGVVLGIFLSLFIVFLFSLFFISKYFNYKFKKLEEVNTRIFLKEFKNYTFRFFLATLGITIISNTDIILVRHFFDPAISGQYAALSLMGKAIFYLTSPIYFVFFPLIAYKKEKKEKILATLLLASAIVILFSASLSFVYFLFPHLILNIFFPEYYALSPYLGPFSLFILVFSLAYLLNNFLLSIGKTGIYKINLFAGLILVVSIFIFHETLYQVIGILFLVSFLLLISLIIYYWYNGRD